MGDLFLPSGYRENPPTSDDSFGDFWTESIVAKADPWQRQVYELVARMVAGASTRATVVDIGCGTGGKLAAIVAPVARCVGFDQESGIRAARRLHPEQTWVAGNLSSGDLWQRARSYEPDVALCSDVIEHVVDPLGLLARLRALVSGRGRLVISTPDREVFYRRGNLGPPSNQRHVREWAAAEFAELLHASGLTVEETHHFHPRSRCRPDLELRAAAGRVVRREGILRPRSCMVFVCSG